MPRLSSFLLMSGLSVSPSAFGSEGALDQAHVLQAASGSSPRPTECRTSGPDRAHTFWDRARDPRLRRYCDLLAKGYARLDQDAAQALEVAKQAQALEPKRSAPRLLEARALVGQGRMAEAFQTFQQVLGQAATPESVPAANAADRLPGGNAVELSPAGLYAYAVAAVGSGQIEQGLSAYRRVVPMASLLSGEGASERVYVEAAVLVMQRDPAQLQEAVAYLNEARRQNANLRLRPFVLSALALALDRQGRHEEARGVAREAHGHTALLMSAATPAGSAGPSGARVGPEVPSESPRMPLPRVDPVELLAMAAMLAAAEAPELARQYWKDFVERAPASHPWLAHARGKLATRG